MRNNSFTLTYVEGLLLATNAVSASALYEQHNALLAQNNTITQLSGDVSKLNKELPEMKTAQTVDVASNTAKLIDTTYSLSDLSSFISPKAVAGVLLAGVVYYGTPIILAKLTSYSLSTAKSLLVPIVSLFPFTKEVKSIEAVKDGHTYRVQLIGDEISKLEVRAADSSEFRSLTDLSTLQPNPTPSHARGQLTSEISSVSSGDATSLDVATATDVATAPEIVNQVIDILSTIS